jgi:DNA-binding NarL/FixJ family response regulator
VTAPTVFTPAQWAILEQLILDGPDNAEIAVRLGISYDTVKCQIWRASYATGCINRTQLAVGLLRGTIPYEVHDRRHAA